MAMPGWRTDRPLTSQLRHETPRFDFYQLVRLLLRERGAAPSVLDSHLRFFADLEQSFPAHEVRAVEETPESGQPLGIRTGNYVLAGSLGPMPEALIEQMRDRMRDGDEDMAHFLDVFNHRINALRYRLKEATALSLNLKAPEHTFLAQRLSALMGMAAPGLSEQLPLKERQWLGLAGLLANPRRSPVVVTRVVACFVGAQVSLAPLLGAWRERSAGSFTILGGGQELGHKTRLGTRAWLPAARILLTIGPLSYARFCQLLPGRQRTRAAGEIEPGNSPHGQLVALLRFLLARRQDAWIELKLAAGQVQEARLTARPSAPGYYGLRLGQTAWLTQRHGAASSSKSVRFLVHALAETYA